jgi:hypothetical protein
VGLFPSSIKLLLKLHTSRKFSGPVCVLGNQEVWATYEDLVAIFEEMGCEYKRPSRVVLHTSAMFRQNPWLKEISASFVHARVLFEMLGIQDYCDIDKFDWDEPMLQHDLNVPVPEEFRDRFNLVIDGGAAEHVFDVRQVMANIVAMTRVGGTVIQIASLRPDHGFYSFSPCLFFDYYKLNGFENCVCYVLLIDQQDVLTEYAKPKRYFEYRYGDPVAEVVGTAEEALVFFTARKHEAMQSLNIPTQGVYGETALNKSTSAVTSRFDSLVPQAFQPLMRPLRPWVRRLHQRIQRLSGFGVDIRTI